MISVQSHNALFLKGQLEKIRGRLQHIHSPNIIDVPTNTYTTHHQYLLAKYSNTHLRHLLLYHQSIDSTK
jgi:hypothetical protein